ncbi:MAG TPA: hypothetical protein VF707_14480 [Ardenticatenaceae bacterium]
MNSPPTDGNNLMYHLRLAQTDDLARIDPQLAELETIPGHRNPQQKRALEAAALKLDKPADDVVFDGHSPLDWAYHCCVLDLKTQHPNRKLFPQVEDVPGRSRSQAGNAPNILYLFNILVALEWVPNEEYMQQLRWAFRRASDHLFDVTEGHMAFGMVVFGGPELMKGADIQILASNRFHPRSWVEGLHNPDKYLPIRMGRSLWSGRNRVSYDWSEPEGYRTLVHEWLHYALCLKDEYLTTVVHEGEELRVPIPPANIDSATQDTSISEVVLDRKGSLTLGKLNQYFPGHGMQRLKVVDGPYRLPLPLPDFAALASFANQAVNKELMLHFTDIEARLQLEQTPTEADPQPEETSNEADLQLEETSQADEMVKYQSLLNRTSVYLLREKQTNGEKGYERLIPQGSLGSMRVGDDSSPARPYEILGARESDTLVLIVEEPETGLSVHSRKIRAVDDHALALEEGDWAPPLDQASFKPPTPMLAVVPVPDPIADGTGGSAANAPSEGQSGNGPAGLTADAPAADDRKVKVRVSDAANLSSLWLFPLGQPFAPGVSGTNRQAFASKVTPPATGNLTDEIKMPSLDGYVLAEWKDGRVLIYPFSQGGGPPNHEPVGSSPVTAGSSDGHVMLFFYSPEDEIEAAQAPKTDNIKVVTTLVHGEPSGANDSFEGSYVYALSSTQPLLKELRPTLVLFYDRPASGVKASFDFKPVIQRWIPAIGNTAAQWLSLTKESYARVHSPLVALALREATAPRLTDPVPLSPDNVEYYRLFWTRHTQS